jgi:molybdopterin/thiamine biosynthesis adenylyltransferase
MQAAEALKLLLQVPGTLTGRILLLDALSMEWSDMRLPRNSACTVCGTSSGHN